MSALKELFWKRGHILITCVKCHPELAGCGIEFSWGKSKLEYRKNNDTAMNKKTLLPRIKDSLSKYILPIERIWKFERRTRDYRNNYAYIQKQIEQGNINNSDLSHDFVEKMVKEHKAHRNILDMECRFLNQN